MKTDSNSTIKFLTPSELATFLKVSKTSVYRLVDNRKLPFYKVGGSLRFDLVDVMDYLSNNRIGSV